MNFKQWLETAGVILIGGLAIVAGLIGIIAVYAFIALLYGLVLGGIIGVPVVVVKWLWGLV